MDYGTLNREQTMPTTDKVVPGNWVSVRGGKWHLATSERPEPTREETAVCGVKFYPLNVTWGEAPPTIDYWVCKKCVPDK